MLSRNRLAPAITVADLDGAWPRLQRTRGTYNNGKDREMYSDWKDQVLPPVKTKSIQVYEVDSDRGTYWESNPFVPEIWDGIDVATDPWPTIKALSEAGYEVHVKSHAAYLEWLKARGDEPDEQIPYWELD